MPQRAAHRRADRAKGHASGQGPCFGPRATPSCGRAPACRASAVHHASPARAFQPNATPSFRLALYSCAPSGQTKFWIAPTAVLLSCRERPDGRSSFLAPGVVGLTRLCFRVYLKRHSAAGLRKPGVLSGTRRTQLSEHVVLVCASCRAVSLRDTARGGVRVSRPTHTIEHDMRCCTYVHSQCISEPLSGGTPNPG